MEEARDRFFLDMFAPSNRHVVQAKVATVTKMLKQFGLDLYPPTVEKVHALGIMLKAGKYKSAESYVREYKGACERQGHNFDGVLARAARDTIRSCMRGSGQPGDPLSKTHPSPLRGF